MPFPRFTVRTILAVTTALAVFFLLVGAGYRGQAWATGAAIGAVSLCVAAVVQAACFVVVWCFARLFAAGPRGAVRRDRDSAPGEATT
jgi:hypothetical protein